MFARRSRWRACIGERLAGSNGRPASTPSGTAAHGGRAVVRPTSAVVPAGLRAPSSRADASWHMRPWQGPIVTVV